MFLTGEILFESGSCCRMSLFRRRTFWLWACPGEYRESVKK